jgi:membrane protein required for colicin V production
MNIIDLIIIAIIVMGAYRGFKNGIIIELASLLGILTGIYCAIHYTDLLMISLPDWKINRNILETICFVFLFIISLAIFYGIGKLIEKLISVVLLGKLNQLLGVLFGMVKTAFILSAIIVLFSVFDKNPDFIPKQAREESRLYHPLSQLIPSVFPLVKNSISSLCITENFHSLLLNSYE